jgi:hypothetical protein
MSEDIVFNDVYKPHSSEELKALLEDGHLSPDFYAGLDPKQAYGTSGTTGTRLRPCLDPAVGIRIYRSIGPARNG